MNPETFVPAEAAKKTKTKIQNRKTRCIFVTFKLKQLSDINAVGISMTLTRIRKTVKHQVFRKDT